MKMGGGDENAMTGGQREKRDTVRAEGTILSETEQNSPLYHLHQLYEKTVHSARRND